MYYKYTQLKCETWRLKEVIEIYVAFIIVQNSGTLDCENCYEYHTKTKYVCWKKKRLRHIFGVPHLPTP